MWKPRGRWSKGTAVRRGGAGRFLRQPTQPLKPLKDRKFVQIDRDNFNDVMARMTPGLKFQVANTLKGDGSELRRRTEFNSLEDFGPGARRQAGRSARKALETRQQAPRSVAKVDRSQDLEEHAEQVLEDAEMTQETVGRATGRASPGRRSGPSRSDHRTTANQRLLKPRTSPTSRTARRREPARPSPSGRHATEERPM